MEARENSAIYLEKNQINQEKSRADLLKELAALPKGSLGKKTVKGRVYYYHRWYEDGKRVEKYVPAQAVETLREQLARRKQVESQLKNAPDYRYDVVSYQDLSADFVTDVRCGRALRIFARPVEGWKKRECFQKMWEYLYGDTADRVLVLCGLRRTGKTTLIRQALLEMSDEDIQQTAFIQIKARDTLADVNHDLRILEALGYRFVFIDEATLMEDFIQGAALFSDVFATCGMKIVLSGTDSLGFLFAEDEQLYDRCYLLHTTFVPYREFENVLGISGIDDYISYGGTMSISGRNYNLTSLFASKDRADEYVNSAIAHNIQHSLRCYQHGGHLRSLRKLYENDELTSAINRVVEDINHRFTLEVLSRDFQSHDLALSAQNLRNDRRNPDDILDRVDTAQVTKKLKELLEVRDAEERCVELQDEHALEIEEYLSLLDLTVSIPVVDMSNLNRRDSRVAVAQPGLRYAQADALVGALLLDEEFRNLTLAERTAVLNRIRSEIKGRMMEDIVLLETQAAYPHCQVFKLQFPIGEFDMVVFNPETLSCEIYEVKYSCQAVAEQSRHLRNEEKRRQTEHRFGSISGTYVIYRGDDQTMDGVTYLNVEGYLKQLPSSFRTL